MRNTIFGIAPSTIVVPEQQMETQRANWLLALIGGGLIVSAIIYVVLHLYIPVNLQAKLTLANVEQVLSDGQIGFWSTGVWHWVELFFWSWFGTLSYLLTEIHEYYPSTHPDRRFRDKTPWYFPTALRGPFIALLVLLFLSTVLSTVQIKAVGISIGQETGTGAAGVPLPVAFEVFLAAVLGFYSRVARAQLDSFVAQVFPTAWQQTQKGMSIEPVITNLELGTQQPFSVMPDQDVTWSKKTGDPGTVTDDGIYTAPPSDEAAAIGKMVTLTATSSKNRTKAVSTTFTLAHTELHTPEFTVEPIQTKVKLGNSAEFKVLPPTEVHWKIEPSIGIIDPESGKYTAPLTLLEGEAKPIAVIATAVKNPEFVARGQLTLSTAE